MERDYFRAAYPCKVRILGRELKPFSLGHLQLLRSLENGFVLPEKKIGPGDLIQGVFICSQNYADALRSIDSRWRDLCLRFWGWRCGSGWSLVDKAAVFKSYVADGSQPPDLHEPDDDCRSPGAPFIQRVRIRLMSYLGMSFSEVMDYPWGLALHDYFASYESDDRVKILNQDESEMIEEHERLWQEYKQHSKN